MKQPATPKTFDPVKLEGMQEPLSIRVEKERGGQRTPIPLPAGEDGSPQGTNWSKEDVLGLEAWLVNEWAGGGAYALTVTDSTQPSPQRMDWKIFYNPAQYPEKTPPTLSAPIATPVVAPVQPSAQQVRTMAPSVFPSGFPTGLPMLSPQQPMTFPTQGWAPSNNNLGSFYASQAAAQADADRRRLEEQLRATQELAARQREEMMAAQHRQDLERAEQRMRQEQAAQNDKFSKLEQLIATLASTVANAKPAVDPALEAIKEQNRMLEARLEAEKQQREFERRERETQEQIRRQAEEFRQQTAELREALQSNNKGLDPMMMMMQELSRQQIEASREAARAAESRMASMQAFMMNPRDVMAMAKEASNGLDGATRSVANAYENVMGLQNKAIENILQLNNTGGSETIGLIKEGMERAAAFAEKYVGGKVREATVGQQSQAQIAQASAATEQARAAQMQAEVQARALAAQVEARKAQQANGATPGPGTNGAPAARTVAIPPRPTVEAPAAEAPKPANDTWTTGPVPPATADAKVQRRLGKTDEEWFGQILPQVKELREGVARFFESLAMEPKRLITEGENTGHVDGVEPEQAAMAILSAGMYVQQNQIPINAMIELFGQGRVADFMDVLLPDAPQPYRDEVAQLVITELQGGGDDEEDDEDDEDDDEGEVEAAPQPTRSVIKPTPRARA